MNHLNKSLLSGLIMIVKLIGLSGLFYTHIEATMRQFNFPQIFNLPAIFHRITECVVLGTVFTEV